MGYFASILNQSRVPITLSLLFIFCGLYTTLSPPLFGFLAFIFSVSIFIFRKAKQPIIPLEKISPQDHDITNQIEDNREENNVIHDVIEEIHEEKEEIDEEIEENGDENEEIGEFELKEYSFEPSEKSISDDESLIEISLPDGDHCENDSNAIFEQEFSGESIWDFLPESIFKQTGLMELLSEINEEDNLIELDITRGSIKCPSLEIMA